MDTRGAELGARGKATVLLASVHPDWPYAGHFREPDAWVHTAVAGWVGDGKDPMTAWALRNRMVAVLDGLGEPVGSAAERVAALWRRILEGGFETNELLSMLIVATGPGQTVMSASGVKGVYAGSPMQPWIQGSHPLLGSRTWPEKKPGGLVLELGPTRIVGHVGGRVPRTEREWRQRTGVHG